MRLPRSGLWQHADFLKLWAGQTVSAFGSRVSFLALPLTAIFVLDATPAQMGMLSALGSLPALLAGLFVGVWVDRRRRRPVLILADVGRGLLLLIIPASALAGVLRIETLCAVTLGMGTLGLCFGVAHASYLPALVGKTHLVEGYSKLELSRSAAEVAGPGLGGALVQLVTAPVALVVDAASFLASAFLLAWIRTPEPSPESASERRSIWREMGDGLRIVGRNPVLRALIGCAGTLNLFNAMLEAVWMLYLTDRLALSPGMLGLTSSIGGVGFLAGAVLVERTTHRLGVGPTVIAGVLLAAASDLVTPLVGGPTMAIVGLLAVAQFCFGFGLTHYNVGLVTLAQATTPDQLRGRMSATMQFVGMTVLPAGALMGGALGEMVGLRSTLFIAVAGETLAAAWLLLSSVRSLRTLPQSSA